MNNNIKAIKKEALVREYAKQFLRSQVSCVVYDFDKMEVEYLINENEEYSAPYIILTLVGPKLKIPCLVVGPKWEGFKQFEQLTNEQLQDKVEQLEECVKYLMNGGKTRNDKCTVEGQEASYYDLFVHKLNHPDIEWKP